MCLGEDFAGLFLFKRSGGWHLQGTSSLNIYNLSDLDIRESSLLLVLALGTFGCVRCIVALFASLPWASTLCSGCLLGGLCCRSCCCCCCSLRCAGRLSNSLAFPVCWWLCMMCGAQDNQAMPLAHDG